MEREVQKADDIYWMVVVILVVWFTLLVFLPSKHLLLYGKGGIEECPFMEMNLLVPLHFDDEAVADGINAHIIAMDYRREESTVSSATTLPVHMTRNGGWCARIE